MLFAASALKGYAIEATDGRLGTVADLLFDDHTWKVRWMVVDTGKWLSGRKVLVHPSSVTQLDHERQVLPVRLTKVQVEESPGISQDEPMSRQMEGSLFNYYGYDPYWGPSFFGAGAIGLLPYSEPFAAGAGAAGAGAAEAGVAEARRPESVGETGDPHLRSTQAVIGYHMQASDGAIGHLETLLVDEASWGVRYLVVDTKNWWPGKHVLLSPYAAKHIDWSAREVDLDVTRDQVKGSPPWDPAGAIERDYERRLHSHYGWPGYGF